jgi:hypothetical protein
MKDLRLCISATLVPSSRGKQNQNDWILRYRFVEPVPLLLCFDYISGHFLNNGDIDAALFTTYRLDGKNVMLPLDGNNKVQTNGEEEVAKLVDEMSVPFCQINWKDITRIIDHWWSEESLFVIYDDIDFAEWEAEESDEEAINYQHVWY